MTLRFPAVILIGWLGLAMGCYDGAALLVREARSTAVNTRVAEVDLGRFLTTMPRDRNDSSVTELEVHLFATVPRSKVSTVKAKIAEEEYRMRHDLLATVRGASPDELTEPSLAQLRNRVEEVVNEILRDSPVSSVGFYAMTLRRR